MSDVKIKLNKAEIRDLLQSAEMASAIRPYAEAIASSAPHCSIDEASLNTRVRVGVVQKMTHDDMENHTLLRAVHFQ
jgi:hypothetical protein